MDARIYFQLADSIGAADSAAALDAMRDLVRSTEMHPGERKALECVLRSRAVALGLAEREETDALAG